MEESFETGEMQEKLNEAIERAEEAGEEKAAPRWTMYMSLSTAVIAVLAAIASLQAGSLANEALLIKNDAVLSQAKASDQWSYYQAKGIKGIMFETQAEALTGHNSGLSAKFHEEAKRYKDEQGEIKEKADEIEKSIAEKNEESDHVLHRHEQFALAVTLFQVAIALSAIAALARRKPLWFVSLSISVGALFYFARGFLLR